MVGIHADKDGLRGVAIIQIDVEGADRGIADRHVLEGFGPAGPISVHRRLHFRSPRAGAGMVRGCLPDGWRARSRSRRKPLRIHCPLARRTVVGTPRSCCRCVGIGRPGPPTAPARRRSRADQIHPRFRTRVRCRPNEVQHVAYPRGDRDHVRPARGWCAVQTETGAGAPGHHRAVRLQRQRHSITGGDRHNAGQIRRRIQARVQLVAPHPSRFSPHRATVPSRRSARA